MSGEAATPPGHQRPDLLVDMHGMVVRTTLSLGAVRMAAPGTPADLALRRGPPVAVPTVAPEGRVMAVIERSGQPGAFATLVELCAGGWILRCHGVCEVTISPSLEDVVLQSDPEADEGLADVLAAGLVVSVVCLLRGHLVLHASCVELDGQAVAMVGRSGGGKSTTATLLCRTGARLVTDDVLRVDPGAPSWCYVGASENRLRASAAEALVPLGAGRRTPDGRVALAHRATRARRLPLSAVVVPYPDRSVGRVRLEQVTPAHALLLLSAFPRVPGWQDERVRGQQFQLVARLVRAVPVLVATMPWGPPFPAGLAAELVEALITATCRSVESVS